MPITVPLACLNALKAAHLDQDLERAGPKGGEIRWHGSQQGQIVMDERKLSVKRPRLRQREGGEVAVPAYEQLNENPRLAERMHEIMVTGVSTRKYDKVLPEMAGTVGASKSSVSREFIKASEKALAELKDQIAGPALPASCRP